MKMVEYMLTGTAGMRGCYHKMGLPAGSNWLDSPAQFPGAGMLDDASTADGIQDPGTAGSSC